MAFDGVYAPRQRRSDPPVSFAPALSTFSASAFAAPTAAPLSSQHSMTAGLTARPSVLVVDDEALHMDLIADTLGDDYEMLFAHEGEAALEIAAAKVPHLILLDVMLPGMDGYEVFRRLKADHRTREIPVIFITGLGDVAAETKGLKMGAVDYISKPINPAPVRARVNTQIDLKLTRDKLSQMAATDGLTGLANRARFDAMLAYEYSRHVRSGADLSLIMLDIDHFKAFNDAYGHVAGDNCLNDIARAISAVVLRGTDTVARYGGEEFVLLLPDTHLIGAVVLAEKVRKAISDLAIPHKYSSAKHVTASLGVASCGRHKMTSPWDIVIQADQQLYAAKADGRNRVAPVRSNELPQILTQR